MPRGGWSPLSDGLPAGTVVNRLQQLEGTAYACTSRGLYKLDAGKWVRQDDGRPCYQYKEEWKIAFAATQAGLFFGSDGSWKEAAFPNAAVYDFLFSPQFLYAGLERGIGLYDRLLDRWASYPLPCAVTSLAAGGDTLYGSGDRGELVASDGRGGFGTVRFPGLFIYTVASCRGRIYVCSDRGLFRISRLADRLTLQSVKPGVPVTDIDWCGPELFMATLSKGVQSIRVPFA
ncbi:hypothetical protein [Paenibacillus humicola]|uniref:hypothetical protein n=1 Tax=Paenibacillus humicola TaxID=3110540 RepID=UPI00237B842F|nr:hypothetical protein [Paenibacillus humicola]